MGGPKGGDVLVNGPVNFCARHRAWISVHLYAFCQHHNPENAYNFKSCMVVHQQQALAPIASFAFCIILNGLSSQFRYGHRQSSGVSDWVLGSHPNVVRVYIDIYPGETGGYENFISKTFLTLSLPH
jgi:hypothetical protein